MMYVSLHLGHEFPIQLTRPLSKSLWHKVVLFTLTSNMIVVSYEYLIERINTMVNDR